MELDCLERLFIVFESEGALEYHMERTHGHGAKSKGKKTQFDATKLLGVQLDNPEVDDFNDDELEVLEGMDIDEMDEAARNMQRQGMAVPEQILLMIAKAKSKSNKAYGKINKIELLDNQGKDMTRIVE